MIQTLIAAKYFSLKCELNMNSRTLMT